jgi:colanic acid/amylovoran biosynthesis glycosyltransferase
MIDHLTDTGIAIASINFKKCNFYPSKFDFFEFPLRRIEPNPKKLLSVRIYNTILFHALPKIYPWYVIKIGGKFDLMHSHFASIGWEYRKLARKLAIPQVVSFYGLDYEWLPYVEPSWRKRYQVLFKEADLFLCEGSHGAKILRNAGCPPEKIKILHLGVDTEKIPVVRRFKKTGELSLLQIASYNQKKGHIYTLRAFIEALRDCPNMTLTLVGRDHEGITKNLQQMLKGTSAESRVTFMDQIDFERLYDFMADYQVFIHPSCYADDMDCEGGAPVVLLDAQATGMPVIATTHCDIPEEVIDGKTGLLSAERDVPTLAASIRRFYRMNEEEYQTFSQAARSHVEAFYNVRDNAAQLQQMYDLLVHSRGAA